MLPNNISIKNTPTLSCVWTKLSLWIFFMEKNQPWGKMSLSPSKVIGDGLKTAASAPAPFRSAHAPEARSLNNGPHKQAM